MELSICKHVFCKPCLLDYFSFLIEQGSVDLLCCPDQECKKLAVKNTISNGKHHFCLDDLKELLTQEQFDRYQKLFVMQSIQSRPDVCYCPRNLCQYPNIKSPDDKLIICTECQFAFCWMCLRSWHGVAQACRLGNLEKLAVEYMGADQETKAYLEMKYTKKIIEKVVKEFEENQLNKEYIANHTTSCPVCTTSIEKSYGCNHMTCSQCSTHFCFLCGCFLLASSAYDHFSGQNSCNGRLFDLPGDENEWLDEIVNGQI
jgi:E3 ubiquitin-protein ligase RNF14